MQDSIKQIEVEFKEFEKTISQKQQDIAKECEQLGIIEKNSTFKDKLAANRQSIEEILKDIDFKTLLNDPIKK